MRILICPGIHHPLLTERFVAGLKLSGDISIFPASGYSPVSALDIFQFMCDEWGEPQNCPWAIASISFSAGIVGAIGAATAWQLLGGKIAAFFALDGWGVPLVGNFPIHRISHDYFTHWSSALLGKGGDSFYADPAVEHLELWRSPQTVEGWSISGNLQIKRGTTVTQFLQRLLDRSFVTLNLL